MSCRIVDIRPDDVQRLPDPWPELAFWDGCRPSFVARLPLRRSAPVTANVVWLAEVRRDWGYCGSLVERDGIPLGFSIAAATTLLPREAAIGRAPTSGDSAHLLTVFVSPALDGLSLARELMLRAAERAVERGCASLEAVGHDGESSCSPRLLSAELLRSWGFVDTERHGHTVSLRMELRTVIRSRALRESPWQRLLGSWTPTPLGQERTGAQVPASCVSR